MAMLCCVSRKACGAGSDGEPGGGEISRLVLQQHQSKATRLQRLDEQSDALKSLDDAVLGVAKLANSFTSFRRPECLLEQDAAPQSQELVGCRVCGRNFNPKSVGKHERICERTAARKRKPFDSAKQRIQGTELAEFLPKQSHQAEQTAPPSRRPSQDDRPLPRRSHAWKEKRDDFLKAIRAARGADTHAAPTHQSSNNSSTGPSGLGQQLRPSTLSLVTSSGAPLRANEKGQCPTCHRQFGVKSYERHVAFCRERATRLPNSPLANSNPARERLEARMSYRAPQLRNRRPTNREKYSPGAAHKLGAVQSPLAAAAAAAARSPAKEPAPVRANPPAHQEQPASPKLPLLKRVAQPSKESSVTSNGPLKSRPMDRSNRSSDSQESLNPPAARQLFASRRLLLLSEILPSRNLHQSKSSLSSNSSQTTSPKPATTVIYRKEIAENPTRRTKGRGIETSPENELAGPDWDRICEDDETIDKEEEPAMSDVTGLSSSRAESALDDFEYNEKCCEFGSARAAKRRDSNGDSALDRTYAMAGPLALDSSIDSEAFINLLKSNGRGKRENHVEDESLEEFGRENEGENRAKRKSMKRVVEEEDDEEPISAPVEASQTTKSYIIKKDGIETVFDKKDEPRGAIKSEIRDRLIQSKKYHSMPNIVDSGIKRVVEITCRTEKRQGTKCVYYNGDATTPDSREPEGATESDSTPKQQQQQQRCVTYVIEEPRQFAPADESSGDKLRADEPGPGIPWRSSPLPVYDYYYRNDSSDASSVRTELPELEDDLPEENESNASELLKEIDGQLGGSLQRPFTDDSLAELSTRLKCIDLTRPRPRSSRGLRYESFAERDEDTPRFELCQLTPRAHGDKDGGFLPIIRSSNYRRSTRNKPIEDSRLPSVRWSNQLSLLRRSFERLPRCDWDGLAARRRPDFSMMLRRRTGDSKYDPFLLAEQQLNDLFSDTSDQSSTEGTSVSRRPPQTSPSSAAANPSKSPIAPQPTPNQQRGGSEPAKQLQPQQRASVIAPPMGFDDLTSSSELSSDCAETNSLSREPLSSSSNSTGRSGVLGRRLIIDQSQALGGGEFAPRKPLLQLLARRGPESNASSSSSSSQEPDETDEPPGFRRSSHHSLFDQLLLGSGSSSYDERLPHLMSILADASSSVSSSATTTISQHQPGRHHHHHLQESPPPPPLAPRPVNCSDDDAEMSSPESVKRCGGKLSADSAYSSLNRKYSTYGRSTNDVNGRCKPSRFCHECGSRFPDGAKFCCECGVKRLTV